MPKGRVFFCCSIVSLCVIAPLPCWAREQLIGVLISREIAPYAAMVEGLESTLKVPVRRFFLDDKGQPFTLGGGAATLDPQAYDALVAVGPEALHYLGPLVESRRLAYGMVLHPEAVLTRLPARPCGVSLDLPAEAQLAAILQHLPDLERLGVLFDPANNQAWFDSAATVAVAKGFTLVPLQVLRQEERLDLVGDYARLDAILFIPDKTVISKAVIQFVIKQAVVKKIPVIGYNQFFHDAGAALNFMIDYQGVGEQVALQVERLLAGESCQGATVPRHRAVVNQEVWRALDLPEEGGR